MFRLIITSLLLLAANASAWAQDWRALYSEAERLKCESDYGAAADAYRRLLSDPLQDRIPPPMRALALAELGLCLVQPEETVSSDSCFRLAMQTAQTLTPPDTCTQAHVLYQYAASRMMHGETAIADSSARDALRLLRSSAGPDSVMAKILTLLGQTANDRSDYRHALDFLKEALHYSVTLPPPNQRLTMNCYISLGNLYQHLGKPHTAAKFHRLALSLVKQSQPRSVTEALCLTNLASDLEMCNRLDDALHAFEEAMAIYTEKLEPDDIEWSPLLTNMAILHERLGNYAAADSMHLRVLDIDMAAFGADYPTVARDLNDLGYNRMMSGDFAAANQFFLRAQGILQQRYGPCHPDISSVWASLSTLYAAQGEREAATTAAQNAYDLSRQLFRDEGRALNESSALDFARQMQDDARRYLSCLLEADPRDDETQNEIARVVFSTKGIVSDIAFARRRAEDELADSALAPYLSKLNSISQELADLYTARGDEMGQQDYAAALTDARQRKDDAELGLAQISAEFSAEHEIWNVAPEDFAGKLPRNAVVIEYLRHDHYLHEDTTEARYLAVVLTEAGETHICPLGPASRIDSAVAAYSAHMRDGILDFGDYAAISADLMHLVWQPLSEFTSHADPIFIAPDGALNLVSFGGLLSDGGHYLIEDHHLTYLSAARDLLRTRTLQPSVSGVLAMGDPDYALDVSKPGVLHRWWKGLTAAVSRRSADIASSNRSSLSRGVLRPLPQTRREIRQVVSYFRQRNSEPADTFLGAQATKEVFKQRAPGKRMIHLATHGFYAGSQVQSSNVDSLLEDEDVGESDALLNSGFYLAGASATGRSDSENGVVTAEEVARMHLNGTELVVISTCESGRGDIREGEGVYGLRRAFHLAGVRTVISTLWPIPDASTAELTPRIYEDSASSPSDALRNAQLRFLTQAQHLKLRTVHPFYWAAFIAAENGEIGVASPADTPH